MSKSTPINQLPVQSNNMDQSFNPNNNNNNENDLVQEILKEIEDNSGTMPQELQPPAPQQIPPELSPQMPPQPPQQMNQNPPQMPQDLSMNPQMMAPMAEQPMDNMPYNMAPVDSIQNLSTLEVIINEVKTPGIVSVIVILLSLPQINSLITNLLPNKQFILNNSNVLIIVLKSILAGTLFYGLNKTLM